MRWTSLRTSFPSNVARSAAGLCLGAAIATAGLPDAAAAQAPQKVAFELRGKAMKTKPANKQRIAPLLQALERIDGAASPAADRDRELERAAGLVGQAKSEIRSFAGRLQASGEIESFDELARAQAEKDGSAELRGALQEAGGAYRVISRADAYIDEALAQLRNGSAASDASATGARNRLLAFLAPKPAYASEPAAVVCGLFWWTISLGYGEAHAYRSCYY